MYEPYVWTTRNPMIIIQLTKSCRMSCGFSNDQGFHRVQTLLFQFRFFFIIRLEHIRSHFFTFKSSVFIFVCIEKLFCLWLSTIWFMQENYLRVFQMFRIFQIRLLRIVILLSLFFFTSTTLMNQLDIIKQYLINIY